MTGALALAPASNKQTALAAARPWLAQNRAAIRARFMESGDVAALLAEHTRLIDSLLAALYQAAAPKPAPVLSLLAVGGYGRGELFPYSDIDIVFLYAPKHKTQADAIAEYILYVLWDLGLKTGQSHRTAEEALALAQEDFTIRTNVLDARFIAGDQTHFTQFQKRFADEIVAIRPMEFIEAKLSERDNRHTRFGDSRYMLEPNVKEGKGGLRDLHTLWWLARYSYPIATLKDLVKMKLLTTVEYREFERAREFLWQVRAYLHYQTERAEERLTFDRQHDIALKMGYKHPSKNQAIEGFMRRYFAAVRTVGNITRIFCTMLEEEKKRKPSRGLSWLLNTAWLMGPFQLEAGRLSARHMETLAHSPILMLELFQASQQHGLDISPKALRAISLNLKRIDDEVRAEPLANALFMKILQGKTGVEATLRRMSDSGFLGKFIPDFGRVVGQTQFNMYHVYTVDEHTLVAIGILQALEQGQMKEEAPLASDLIGRIQMRRVLYLALFCHDIAKGKRHDHSELGEKLVRRLAARMGFSADEIDTAAWLVRYHLLFSNTAFKRDLNDPKTIADFVGQVQTSERLRLLLILTVADIRAVGPAVWNHWKAALLRDLYTRAEQFMGTGEAAAEERQAERLRDKLATLLPGWSANEIEHYIEQGNPSFLSGCDLFHHATIARMFRQAEHLPSPLLIDTRHDYNRGVTELIICTFDQHELFSKIAGAISLGGANIINAKIFTLKNGMAIDIFQVQEAGSGAFDRPDRLAKVSVNIEQALAGQIDLSAKLSRSSPDYMDLSRKAFSVPGQVFIENNASNIFTVIELSGHDRPGFLYDVTKAIAELGLSISTAHISTYGTQVADVFYVKDIFGMKILHETKQRQVRQRLLQSINRVL